MEKGENKRKADHYKVKFKEKKYEEKRRKIEKTPKLGEEEKTKGKM